MIWGHSNDGKSLLAVDLLVCAAAVKSWGERFGITRPLTSLYCTAEGRGSITNRFRAASRFHGVSEETLQEYIRVLPEVPLLFDDEHHKSAKRLIARCRMSKVTQLDLLVLDSLTYAVGGADENNPQVALNCMETANYIAQEIGCAVIIVHHLNKNGDGRGSSVYKNCAEFILNVNRKRSYFELTCAKVRDLTPFTTLTYRFADSADFDSAVIEWIEPPTKTERGLSQKVFDLAESLNRPFMSPDIQKELNDGTSIQSVSNALAKLAEQGSLTRKSLKPGKKPGKLNPWIYSVKSPE